MEMQGMHVEFWKINIRNTYLEVDRMGKKIWTEINCEEGKLLELAQDCPQRSKVFNLSVLAYDSLLTMESLC